MVHESLETRQFGFIHPVWFPAKQPYKAEYQKRPKPHKKAPRFSRRGADSDSLLVLARVLFEHAVHVDGGLLEYFLLDVGIDSQCIFYTRNRGLIATGMRI